MDTGKKLWITIILGSGLVLTILFLLLFYSFDPTNNTPQCGNKTMPIFCGTKNIPEYAQPGKDIFNSNCAACHKLNSTYNPINLYGPLADSIYFNRFISNQNTLKKHNKQLIKQVGKNKFYLHLFKITPEESAALYSYIAYFVKE